MAPSSSQDAREGVRRRQYLTVHVSSQQCTGDLQISISEIRFRIEHVQQLIQPRSNAVGRIWESHRSPPMTTRRLHSFGVGWRTTCPVQDRCRVASRLWTMICSDMLGDIHWILLVAVLAIGNRAQWVLQRGSSLPWERLCTFDHVVHPHNTSI
jgi:hypothetical protein